MLLTAGKIYTIFGATAREIDMRQRKDDMTKPSHMTNGQWLASLLSDKADLLRQTRREIHTRGNQHQKYFDRLERAIVRAMAGDAVEHFHKVRDAISLTNSSGVSDMTKDRKSK
jgi:hypothetical protein